MHAASRHWTPSLTSLPKDGGVSCFLVVCLEGRPSSFWLYTAMLNFSEANGTGWTAWPLTPKGFRSCDNLQLPPARTTCNGLDTISFRGCRLWQALPNDIKQSNTLSSFKSRIKLWKGEECNCRICRPFVAQVGFLSWLFKEFSTCCWKHCKYRKHCRYL